MTFGLVYTVYATAIDPKKGNIGIIAPIAIGFIVGANILAGGAFDGASMNPAVSFGPAVVSWTWSNHWVYWLGPFIGAAIAAFVYSIFYLSPTTHEQLPTTDYWELIFPSRWCDEKGLEFGAIGFTSLAVVVLFESGCC